ncbi:MEC1 [Candida pseudojiufengensis]|uniref:MEC1 n=1 Tax=Candida pseudojiufengensis TaxID=497109 RepID=UPI002223FE66|nr:MEC1 [Candida pseudojiufengensis]KAI5964231.1 MEC1 [Candida pseudojiufengensis]
MTSAQKLSSEELLQFLNDIKSNINDQDTDFKKLILYLLQFLNSKLKDLNTGSKGDDDILIKMVDTIELMLSKKIYLLNVSLKYQDISLIYVPTSNSSLIMIQEILLYEWLISFIYFQLSTVTSKPIILNHLKSLLIHIINLVSTKLFDFKFIKLLRENLIKLLVSDIDYCFNQIISCNNPTYLKKLISACHLYSIVNDYVLVKKLSLNSNGYSLKLELLGKKLMQILNEAQFLYNETNLIMIDNLKSLLFLNHLDNILIDDTTNWNHVQLLLTWISDFIYQNFEQLGSKTNGFEYPNIVQSISIALFKIYSFCEDQDLIHNFIQALDFEGLIRKLPAVKSIPISIKCTLFSIFYHLESNHNWSTKISDSSTIDFKNFQFASAESNDLKSQLSKENNKITDKLNFIILDKFKYLPPQNFNDNDAEIHWIRYIRSLVQSQPKELEKDITMFTLLTALSKFITLSSTQSHEVSKHRLPVQSTTQSLILDEIIHQFFIPRMDYLKSKPLVACNFFIMLQNYYSLYLPQYDESPNGLLSIMLQILDTHPNRNLRILVTKIIPLYLIKECNEVEQDKMFKFIFQRTTKINFTSKNRRHFGESTIYSVVELAKVSNGNRLYATYLKLVDWLGEPNDQHSNYAYCGFLDIAHFKKTSPYKMLSPYLSTIAAIIITKPLVCERLIQVMSIQRNYFLNRTKEYTVPKLLEYFKDTSLIGQIADAANMSIQKLLASNLPKILALYLVQDPSNERYVIKVLSSNCPDYKSVSTDEIFTAPGEIVWYILLEIQLDDKGNIRNLGNIISALEIVAKNSKHHKHQRAQKGKIASSLIEEQILLLVQKFSDVTHSLKSGKPYMERRSAFQAILYLIKNHAVALTFALGQLSTCLQAMLEEPDFHVLTLTCWRELVEKLPSTHLISLIDIAISIIFQKFQSFGTEAQDIAIDILKKIYKEIKDKYSRYSLYYLSIPFLDYMSNFNFIKEFRNMKSLSRVQIFQEFSRRLNTHNQYVVEQALFDLYNYFKEYQINCQKDFFKDSSLTDSITVLVRTILDTASQFKNKNPKITSECAKVLAVFGALDANKFHFKTVKHSIIVQQNFENQNENTSFLIDLIENHVLKLFWASNDPQKQLFAAFALQEFLGLLELSDDKVKDSNNSIWMKFSDVAKSTLTPFLTSKYTASSKSKLIQIEFPYYKSGMKYETWLIDLTLYLLKKGSYNGKNKEPNIRELIFQNCAILLKDQDISICQHLFKYTVLSHILCLNHSVEKELLEEFKHIFSIDTNASPSDRTEELKLCFQTIFSVFDYCNEWLSATTQIANTNGSSVQDSVSSSEIWLDKIDLVERFIGSFNMDLIAIKSAECDSYERTIMYIEKCYRDGQINSEFKLGDLDAARTLQNMYANINDYDALNGSLKIFSSNNMNEKLKTFQYSDNWSLALESFKVVGDGSSKVSENKDLLKALNEYGSYNDVLSNLSELTDLRNLSEIPLDWALVGLRSAVYSGKPDQLTKWLEVTDFLGKPNDTESLVNYELAHYITSLYDRNKKITKHEESMQNLYKVIGNSLVSSTSSNFIRNVSLMNQLHAIYDMEEILRSSDDATDQLKLRLGNVDQDFDTQNKILTLHLVANQIIKKEKKISEIYLHQSNLARESGRLDISTSSIVKAMASNNPVANIEYSKLLWTEGKQSEAIKNISEILKTTEINDIKFKAKIQLQYANWLDESNHLSANQIIEEYTKAFEMDKNYENSSYDIGKYFNKLMDSSKDESGYYQHLTVRNFIRAVSIGSSFIFEALPKLITIWLDFAKLSKHKKIGDKKLKQIIQDLTDGLKTVPTYAWYTAITQILSRIVHEHEPSYKILATIVATIISEYPRHSLWYVLSHTYSGDQKRKDRINKILVHSRKRKDHETLILEAQDLFSKFISIAQKTVNKSARVRQLSLTKYFNFPDINRAYDQLVIPVQSNLQIRIPHKEATSYTAFPRSASVTFNGFYDQVNIFFSLQMPRQITIKGSDGKNYRLMIKSDDTRKDAKVVEFTTMVNRILSTSTEARKRNLNVANYSVIPLSENIGIIEFVTNVQTMKSIINEQRKRKGKTVNERQIFNSINQAQKNFNEKNKDNKSMKHLIELFKSICEKNPPLLHQWFIENFPDPSSWYMARNSFIRSSAVMSIVGYLIGLGDRHCENILFFKNSGSILHIDFDCLFEKGLTLPTPEIVPFRLTQNMVDAMGIVGVDGSFRISCEQTGKLLRLNEQSLMNILETLLYDPLCDWKINSEPQNDLLKVRKKTRGLINEEEGLVMNIHGQVDFLIQEATSIERLAQMYGGWSAYI